jgi:hypothetical protein
MRQSQQSTQWLLSSWLATLQTFSRTLSERECNACHQIHDCAAHTTYVHMHVTQTLSKVFQILLLQTQLTVHCSLFDCLRLFLSYMSALQEYQLLMHSSQRLHCRLADDIASELNTRAHTLLCAHGPGTVTLQAANSCDWVHGQCLVGILHHPAHASQHLRQCSQTLP